MYNGKKKLIGVFVNNIDNSFQPEICTTVSRISTERGYDVAVFNTFGNASSENVYENLEVKLIDLAPIERMDAIIVLADTFGIYSQRYYLLEQIKNRRRRSCPVISLRGARRELDRVFGPDNYYSITINEEKSYETLIEHVIAAHGARKICFMSGPEGHEDAIARLNCFLRVCGRYGIELHKNAIFYGDFWRNMTGQALDHFYSDPSFEPDAIICANDYMAIEIVMELKNRGKRIPEDVIVTGFDNLPESNCLHPTLTTMGVIGSDMARIAVRIAENCWNGVEQPMECKLEPCIKKRESCGCNITDQYDLQLDQNQMLKVNNMLFSQQMSLAYTYMGMSGCRTLRDIADVTSQQIRTFSHMKEFYLLLYSDDGSDDIASTNFSGSSSERMIVVVASRDGNVDDYYSLPESERSFPRSRLLPEFADTSEPTCYYYVMLHNKEHCFGYTVISFFDNNIYDFNYECWMISCSVGITELISRTRLEQALALNEKMSVTDALTQLFNRRGFEDQAYKIVSKAISCDESICVMSIDLDGLKQINDQYGHAEGDYAIRTVGEAISCLTGDRGIAARIGGDEFMVLRPMSASDKPEDYPVRFEKRFRLVNEESGKPYKISASVGIECAKINSYKELESVIHRSDEKLYAAKRQLRRRSGDAAGPAGK